MNKQRGRVIQSGIVDTELLAEYGYPVYFKNKAQDAWASLWVYNRGGVPEFRVMSGVTKAAATPSSATDGVAFSTGDQA